MQKHLSLCLIRMTSDYHLAFCASPWKKNGRRKKEREKKAIG